VAWFFYVTGLILVNAGTTRKEQFKFKLEDLSRLYVLTITGGVEDGVGSCDMVSSAEGWVSCTDEGAGGCMSTEGEAAGPLRCLQRRHRQSLRSILVQVDGAWRQHQMINS
jgi:hypothetical protein